MISIQFQRLLSWTSFWMISDKFLLYSTWMNSNSIRCSCFTLEYSSKEKSRSSRLLCIQRENKTFCFMGSLWANKLGIDISVSPSIWNSYAEEKGKFPLPPIPRSNPGPHEYVSGDTCGRRRPRVTQSHLVAAFASLDKKC